MKPVAWVTGASRGLGRRVAEILSEKFDLGLGFERTKPPRIEGSIELPGDVADPETSRRAVEALLERFGRLDLFVANAAVTRDKLMTRMTDEDFDRVMDVNLRGVFNGLRACGEALMASRGSALLVSSIIGRRGAAGSANYAAAKSGLVGLGLSAARELAPDVDVNIVIPGYMDTDMGNESREMMEAARREHLQGRLTDVDSAARMIAALAQIRGVTGQIFTVDGRLSRWF